MRTFFISVGATLLTIGIVVGISVFPAEENEVHLAVLPIVAGIFILGWVYLDSRKIDDDTDRSNGGNARP